MSLPTDPTPSRLHAGDAAGGTRPSRHGRRGVLRALGTLAGLGSLGAAGTLLAGCSASEDELAYVRFCNTSVDYGTADFYVDGTRVVASLANGGTVSGWANGTAGSLSVAWHAAGSSSAKLTETRSFEEESYTSVIAYGTLSTSIKFHYLAETNSAASSGKVKLRGLHAAPSIDAVDVYVTNTSSLDGLDPTFSLSALGEVSDFVSLDSGSYRVRVTDSGDASTVLFDYTATITLGSTAVVTLVLSPRASGSLPNVAALAEKASSVLLDNELV